MTRAILLALVIALGMTGQTVSTHWFTATSGNTNCQVSKVSQVPMRLTYFCASPYGTDSGSYTVNAVNGIYGTNYFNLGLNSQTRFAPNPGNVAGSPPLPPIVVTEVDNNLSCLIQVNGTAFDLMMLNGVTVPANSANYLCRPVVSTVGNSTISWP